MISKTEQLEKMEQTQNRMMNKIDNLLKVKEEKQKSQNSCFPNYPNPTKQQKPLTINSRFDILEQMIKALRPLHVT